MASFEHDRVRFSYADMGSGIPFAFQHGLGGDATQPASQAPAGVRLITLECRGHGHTEPLGPEEQLSFDTFARDLAALLDHLELDKVVLGGISMGAGVALALAQLQPSRAHALVLVRPAWTDQRWPRNLHVYREIAALLRDHGPAVGKDVFLAESKTYKRIRAQSPANAASLVAQFDRLHAQEHAAVLERLPADRPIGPAESWSELSMPALVLGAREDPAHPFESAVTLQQLLPDAVLQEIPPKEPEGRAQQQAVAVAIEDFLAEVAAAGAHLADPGPRA
jgi:pimeloyl-ACP methyl ester carboxylesterase